MFLYLSNHNVYLNDIFPPKTHNYYTRESVFGFLLPKVNTYGINSVRFDGVKLWNSLPNFIKGTFFDNRWVLREKADFKSRLKKFLLDKMTSVDD